jgi:hypothetical protein
MKRILFIVWLTFFSNLLSQAQTLDKAQIVNVGTLYGDVKSLTVKEYAFNSKAIPESEIFNQKNIYLSGYVSKYIIDKIERTIKTSLYRANDTTVINSEVTNFYDSLWNLIGIITTSRKQTDVIKFKIKYDANGRIKEKRYYSKTDKNNDNLYLIQLNKYDINGNLIEMISNFINDKESNSKYVYGYNKQANKISETVYIDKNTMISNSSQWRCGKKKQKIATIENGFFYKKLFEYNNNHLAQMIVLNTDKCVSQKTIIFYDSVGNKIDESEYDENGIMDYSWKGIYSKNFLMTEISQSHGSFSYKNEMKYNEFGNLMEKNQYNKNNELSITTKFSYDNFRNWVTQLTMSEGKPILLIERTLTYFK